MSYQSAYYPPSAAQVLPKSFVGTTTLSPWEREEREKENEMRREQNRQMREHHIYELSNLSHRTPHQDEQLKKIILERDFELMAQEQGDMEEDNDTNYGKDNMQEVIRLAQSSNQLSTPLTSMKQVDVKTNIVSQTSYASANANNESMQGLNDGLVQHSSGVSGQTQSAQVQPKSILKHNNARVERTSNSNPSSPSKQAKSTTFADDRQNADMSVSNVVRDLNSMSFNESTISTSSYQIKEIGDMSIDSLNNSLHGPPPPPERNSSYVVMSQKQQSMRNNNITQTITNQSVKKSTTSTLTNTVDQPSAFGQFMISNKKTIANTNNANVNNDSMNNNNDSNNNSTNNGNISISGVNNSNTNANHSVLSSNNLTSPMQTVTTASLASMMAARDNKRVSFHDEENNLIMGQSSGDQAELSIVREDPNVCNDFSSY